MSSSPVTAALPTEIIVQEKFSPPRGRSAPAIPLYPGTEPSENKLRDSVRSPPSEYAWDCGTHEALTMNEHGPYATAQEIDVPHEGTGH
jgi:hypothetical protein